MATTFKISDASLRDFNDTLKKYAQVSKKDAVKIVNTKAYYIARAACRFTPRPEKGKIKQSLSEIIHDAKTTKSGKTRKYLKKSSDNATPIAALLVNWKRGKLGLKGLTGEAMKKAVKTLIASREKARAYLASGWIPAIKKLERLAENPSKAAPRDNEAGRIKKSKGWASVASETDAIAKAIIGNESAAKHSTTADPLGKFGMGALEKAFDHESASMKDYIQRKMQKAAKDCGIKTR